MILPEIGTGGLHVRRRVMTFISSKSTSMLTAITLNIQKASRDGIIPLTFTA
jgi:hypothetical protein